MIASIDISTQSLSRMVEFIKIWFDINENTTAMVMIMKITSNASDLKKEYLGQYIDPNIK